MFKYLFVIVSLFLIAVFSCNKGIDTTQNTVDTARKVIVVLGSSTAEGNNANPIDSSWVNKLKYQLIKDKKNDTVINLARGGYTTYHLMPTDFKAPSNRPQPDPFKNIEKALNLKATFIIINLPSNDIALSYSDKEILDNYKVIINEMRKSNVSFMITSTQPRNFPNLDQRKRLQNFNNEILKVIPDNVIDYYNALTDLSTLTLLPQLDSGDGLHLNNKGHSIIFNELMKDKRITLALGY